MFDKLSSLDTSRIEWRVMVRVTRMWPSFSSYSKTTDVLNGYNLILLDNNNTHVQAYVYADNWKSFSEIIVEGGLYVITNFYIKQALGSLRPIQSEIMIFFSNFTTVEKLDDDDLSIPFHKFRFVDITDLFRIASENANIDNPTFSTDIIGVVENFERVINTVFGDRHIVKFMISDGRCSQKVSVWADLAKEIDTLYDQTVEEPIIAIVTSTKMKVIKSFVHLSTLPCSKVYFNLDNEIVHSLRQRLENEGYIPPKTVKHTLKIVQPAPVIETITLHELGEKTNMDDNKKIFNTVVKITKVEEIANWWYNSSADSNTKLFKPGDKPKCVIHESYFMYRIIIEAADATAAYTFILMDCAVQHLVNKTTSELLSENILCLDSIIYPSRLRQIVGKVVTLKIEIQDDNVLIKSKIFIAIDAFFHSETSSSTVIINTGSSSSSEGEEEV